ncbi:hypothetical protein K523DRAFT_319308 [Schizophyllum commune Tattone D]|nr:hypothetical protein K523DRAFT_319308 [Schizophyllum commune Tattone D]
MLVDVRTRRLRARRSRARLARPGRAVRTSPSRASRQRCDRAPRRARASPSRSAVRVASLVHDIVAMLPTIISYERAGKYTVVGRTRIVYAWRPVQYIPTAVGSSP